MKDLVLADEIARYLLKNHTTGEEWEVSVELLSQILQDGTKLAMETLLKNTTAEALGLDDNSEDENQLATVNNAIYALLKLVVGDETAKVISKVKKTEFETLAQAVWSCPWDCTFAVDEGDLLASESAYDRPSDGYVHYFVQVSNDGEYKSCMASSISGVVQCRWMKNGEWITEWTTVDVAMATIVVVAQTGAVVSVANGAGFMASDTTVGGIANFEVPGNHLYTIQATYGGQTFTRTIIVTDPVEYRVSFGGEFSRAYITLYGGSTSTTNYRAEFKVISPSGFATTTTKSFTSSSNTFPFDFEELGKYAVYCDVYSDTSLSTLSKSYYFIVNVNDFGEQYYIRLSTSATLFYQNLYKVTSEAESVKITTQSGTELDWNNGASASMRENGKYTFVATFESGVVEIEKTLNYAEATTVQDVVIDLPYFANITSISGVTVTITAPEGTENKVVFTTNGTKQQYFFTIGEYTFVAESEWGTLEKTYTITTSTKSFDIDLTPICYGTASLDVADSLTIVTPQGLTVTKSLVVGTSSYKFPCWAVEEYSLAVTSSWESKSETKAVTSSTADFVVDMKIYSGMTLSDFGWDRIKDFCENRVAKYIFETGDTIDISTADGTRTIGIMAWDDGDFMRNDGTPFHIVFGAIHGGYTKHQRSATADSDYNTRFYKNDTYAVEIESFAIGFDSDLQNVLETFIYTDSSNLTSYKNYADYVGKVMAVPQEKLSSVSPTIFEYYKNNGFSAKKNNNGKGDYASFWTSSFYWAGSTIYGCIQATNVGELTRFNVDEESTDVFIFCM